MDNFRHCMGHLTYYKLRKHSDNLADSLVSDKERMST